MTLMGIQYLNHKEQARHNLATEAETNRANLAVEGETKRANLVREAETMRANLAHETETNRSNLAREAETNRSNLAHERETYRSNIARESETRRHNVKTENIEQQKANQQHLHNQNMEKIQADANANQMLRTILDKAGTVEARTAANNLIQYLGYHGYHMQPGHAADILKRVEDWRKQNKGKAFGGDVSNALSNVWGELKGFLGSLLK